MPETKNQEPKNQEPKKFQAINHKVFENSRHLKFEFLFSFFGSWHLGSLSSTHLESFIPPVNPYFCFTIKPNLLV